MIVASAKLTEPSRRGPTRSGKEEVTVAMLRGCR